MRVPRHTTAYGSTPRSRSYTSYRNGILRYSSSAITDRSVRLVPSVGGRTASGFRLPTSWGMHSFRSTYSGYNYTSSTGTYSGSLSDPSHGFGNTSRCTFSSSTVTVQIDPNHLNRVRTEALEKIKEGKFNLGVAVAESRQTAALLCDLVTRLVRGYQAAKRGRWSEAYRWVVLGTTRNVSIGNAAAKAHLEGVYGWLPLISDIFGAQQQLKDGFRKKNQLFKVVREVKLPIDPLEFLSPAGFRPVMSSGSAYVSYKVVYWQKVRDSEVQKLLALGAIDPLVIAWELRPFSFVLDWVLPVGSFLNALTATLGVDFVAGYEDRVVHCDLVFQHYEGRLTGGTPMDATVKQFSFQRVRKLTWDLPVPYWKNPFSTTHVLNAVALLRVLT